MTHCVLIFGGFVQLEPTKRAVAGTGSRIYDPLGILAPITVQFKIMFQELCTGKLDWNEWLAGELLAKWTQFLTGFSQIATYFHSTPISVKCSNSLIRSSWFQRCIIIGLCCCHLPAD